MSIYAGVSCGWNHNTSAAFPQQQYWYYVCFPVSWECPSEMAFEMENGGSGGWDPASVPYNPWSDLKYAWEKLGPDECAFRSRLLQVQTNGGVEVIGFKTTTGEFIILPTSQNTYNTSYTFGPFPDANNIPIAVVTEVGSQVLIELYTGNGVSQGNYTATDHYHTHPLAPDANHESHWPSPDDINFYNSNVVNFNKFYIVHPSRFVQFNGNPNVNRGVVSNVPNNCL